MGRAHTRERIRSNSGERERHCAVAREGHDLSPEEPPNLSARPARPPARVVEPLAGAPATDRCTSCGYVFMSIWLRCRRGPGLVRSKTAAPAAQRPASANQVIA